MIPNVQKHSLEAVGVSDSSKFEISTGDEAHIMRILRDTLYSDKILAVLREYIANAIDAHKMNGKADLPIKVTLPTAGDDLTLYIRDYGPGLSKEDVLNVYTKYGASTKRGDNVGIGMMGVGSKAGFAYSDSFTVTSWHGGYKRIFIAALEESGAGTMNLMHEEACGDETGIEVSIGVRSDDVALFTKKAAALLPYVTPPPIINCVVEKPISGFTSEEGILSTEHRYHYETRWVAVMGGIPYALDANQLRWNKNGSRPDYLYRVSGVLFCQIGELPVSASREEIEYTDQCIAKVTCKIDRLVDDFVKKKVEEIEGTTKTKWEKLLAYKELAPIGLHKKLLKNENVHESTISVSQFSERGYITGLSGRNESYSIPIADTTVVYIKDDRRRLSSLSIPDYHHGKSLLRAREGHTIEEAEADFLSYLDTIEATGLPIQRTSTLPLSPIASAKTPVSPTTPKQSIKVFKYLGQRAYTRNKSKAWEPVEDYVADKDHVYVLIRRFSAEGSFFEDYDRDTELLKEVLSSKMPTVYGFRNSPLNPVDPSLLVGKTYYKWREELVSQLQIDGSNLMEETGWALTHQINESIAKGLPPRIGKKHPISKAIVSSRAALRRHNKRHYHTQRALIDLFNTVLPVEAKKKLPSHVFLEMMDSRYYMLNSIWDHLYHTEDAVLDKLADYIKMVDKHLGDTDVKLAPVLDNERDNHAHPQGKDPHSSEGDSKLPDNQEGVV